MHSNIIRNRPSSDVPPCQFYAHISFCPEKIADIVRTDPKHEESPLSNASDGSAIAKYLAFVAIVFFVAIGFGICLPN